MKGEFLVKRILNRKVFLILFIFILTIVFTFSLCQESFAADPKLITKIKSAFEKISEWLIKISTPAAAVAVGTGVMMKKFSFGDEDKIRTGKKLIRGSLFSYAFILATDLILAAIKSLI